MNTYIHSLFFRFFSHISYYRVLSRVPCTIQQVLISYQFYTWQCVYMSIPISQFISSPPYALVAVCLFSISMTLLFYKSFMSFFFSPHINDTIWYLWWLSVFVLFYSVWQSLNPSKFLHNQPFLLQPSKSQVPSPTPQSKTLTGPSRLFSHIHNFPFLLLLFPSKNYTFYLN